MRSAGTPSLSENLFARILIRKSSDMPRSRSSRVSHFNVNSLLFPADLSNNSFTSVIGAARTGGVMKALFRRCRVSGDPDS